MTLLMSSAKSNFTPKLESVFFSLMNAAVGINFLCIQNENGTLVSAVCAEGERRRVFNAFSPLGLLVYQAWQDLVLVQSANSWNSRDGCSALLKLFYFLVFCVKRKLWFI